MVNYANLFGQLGAELQAMRGIEALFEWLSKVGASYFRDKLNSAYDNTVQSEDDAETLSKGTLLTAQQSAAGVHEARKSSFEGYFFPFLDLVFGTLMSEEDKASGAIEYVYDPTLEANGEIAILERRGRLGALRRQMIADSATIRKNVVTLGALSAAGGNIGVLSETGPAVSEDHTLSGNLVFEVTDDTVGAVILSVSLELTTALIDGTPTVKGDRALTVGKPFKDGQTGFGTKLDLGSVVESGDDGNIFSSTTVTNPSEADSAKGKHYIEVERLAVGGAGPHFRVRWFRSGSLGDTDKVIEYDVTGETGTVAITLIGSSSTIQTTFDKDNAVIKLPAVPNKDSDIVFDIKSPRIGDRWTKSVSNDETGLFATKIARRYRASLNSVANPGQTIDDSKAASIAMT